MDAGRGTGIPCGIKLEAQILRVPRKPAEAALPPFEREREPREARAAGPGVQGSTVWLARPGGDDQIRARLAGEPELEPDRPASQHRRQRPGDLLKTDSAGSVEQRLRNSAAYRGDRFSERMVDVGLHRLRRAGVALANGAGVPARAARDQLEVGVREVLLRWRQDEMHFG